MTIQERIDALNSALAKLNTAIANTRTALRLATDPEEIGDLNSLLTDLEAERQSMQFQLANLEMATPIAEIGTEAVEELRQLTTELGDLVVSGATISAALDFGNAVLGKVTELRKAATA